MKAADIVRTAGANTFRSKSRSILTILAIFVGAFTLSLTSGLGTGINRYIDDTVSAIGSEDVMSVSVTSEGSAGMPNPNAGPQEYDPNAVSTGIPGMTVTSLTTQDIENISKVEGVLSVEPVRSISTDYIQVGDGTKYQVSASSLIEGQSLILADGADPDSASQQAEVALPVSFVEPLGFADNAAAIGHTASIALTDSTGKTHTIDAKIVGVFEDSIASGSGTSVIVNKQMSNELFDAQNEGLPSDQAQRYAAATVRFDASASDAEIQTLKDNLSAAGYTGTTVADQLGMISTVIDGIVLVLNAFGVIALIAAAFGIVNTLYMSVQERTREIGLMKAMGMGSGKVFSLFSLEAAFLGFFGSALGVVVAMLVGSGVSNALSEGLLADLSGLQLIAFDPASVITIILIVVAIAFLSGTLPAARAAKADPVNSLRYE